jgi:hypothetical protein
MPCGRESSPITETGYDVVHCERLRFASDVLVPVAGIGMIAQPLRAALLLDCLEHAGHFERAVPSLGHDVRPEQVGVALKLTTKSQEGGAEAELRALRHGAPDIAADDGADDRPSSVPISYFVALVAWAVP